MKAGRELDALVAETVMGWTRMRWCDYQQDARTTLTYSWHDHHGTMTELAEDDSDYDTPTAAWSPSTEIADAWQVVEKMGTWHGFDFVCRLVDSELSLPHGKKWEAGWVEDSHDGYEGRAMGFADTAPLAICLAALKAVGVEVEA